MQPEPPDAEVRVVAQAIRRYLMDHPHAADTAQGIQRWWLLPGSGELSLQTVEAALAQLEGEGSVRRIEHAWAPAAWARAEGMGH
jgi:hypothetical protein